MIRSRTVATGSSFLAMFFLGMGVAVVGATARNIGLTPAQIGFLVAAQNVGFAVSVLIAGALADLFPKPRILAVGSVILAGSFALLYRTESYAVNLAVMAMMGAGMGASEAVTDALLMDIHDRNESRYITINHFFVSIGSVGITIFLLSLRMNLLASLTQVAVVVFLLSVIFTLLRPAGRRRPVITVREIVLTLVGEKRMLLLFLTGACAIGLGMGTTAIMTTFLVELRGLEAGSAQIGLTLFLVGVASGRLLIGTLARQNRLDRLVAGSFAAAAVLLGVLFHIPVPAWALFPLAFLSGTSVSALLPLTISLAGLMFRHIAGSAMGVVKLAIPVGGIVFPALLSILADSVSFSASLYLFPVIGLLGLFGVLAGRYGAAAERESARPGG